MSAIVVRWLAAPIAAISRRYYSTLTIVRAAADAITEALRRARDRAQGPVARKRA